MTRLDRNLDVFALLPDGVAGYVGAGRRSQDLAGFDAELRAVPGAFNHQILDIALAQWTSDVGAVVVDGVKLAIHLEHGDLPAAGLDQFAGAGGYF